MEFIKKLSRQKFILIIGLSLIILQTTILLRQNKIQKDWEEDVISQIKANREIASSINNQNAILFKTIGEALPVSIPEDKQQKITKIHQDLKLLMENNKGNLKDIEDSYADYLKTTSPWIQEALKEECEVIQSLLTELRLKEKFMKNSQEYLQEVRNYIKSSNHKNLENYYKSYMKNLTKSYSEYINKLKRTKLNTVSTNEVNLKAASRNPEEEELLEVQDKLMELDYYAHICKVDGLLEEARTLTYLKKDLEKHYERYLSNQRREVFLSKFKIFSDGFVRNAFINETRFYSQFNELVETYNQAKSTLDEDTERRLMDLRNIYEAHKTLQGLIKNLTRFDRSEASRGDLDMLKRKIQDTDYYLGMVSYEKNGLYYATMSELENATIKVQGLEDAYEETMKQKRIQDLCDKSDAFMVLASVGNFNEDRYYALENSLTNVLNQSPEKVRQKIQNLREYKNLYDADKALDEAALMIKDFTPLSPDLNNSLIDNITSRLNYAKYLMSLVKDANKKAYSLRYDNIKNTYDAKLSSLKSTKEGLSFDKLCAYNTNAIELMKKLESRSLKLKKDYKNNRNPWTREERLSILKDLSKINSDYLFEEVKQEHNRLWKRFMDEDENRESRFDLLRECASVPKKELTEPWES